jgi:hypothetical protein
MVMAIHPCICMHDVNVTTMTSELFSSFLKATTEPKMYKCQFNARTRGLQDQSTPRSEIRRIDKVWLVCILGSHQTDGTTVASTCVLRKEHCNA